MKSKYMMVTPCGPGKISIVYNEAYDNVIYERECIDAVFEFLQYSDHLYKLHIFIGNCNKGSLAYIIQYIVDNISRFKRVIIHPFGNNKIDAKIKRMLTNQFSQSSKIIILNNGNEVKFTIGNSESFNYNIIVNPRGGSIRRKSEIRCTWM